MITAPRLILDIFSIYVEMNLIDVPGISRAYKDLHITPKFKSRLTIPMHQSAYGKKASSFTNLFFIKKKNKKEFLA